MWRTRICASDDVSAHPIGELKARTWSDSLPYGTSTNLVFTAAALDGSCLIRHFWAEV
jgi:hypothetical protein